MDDDNATDLGNMLNDDLHANDAPAPVDEPSDKGEQQAAPPAAKQEPDLVPRAALMDERRKRQELEQWVEQNRTPAAAAQPKTLADFPDQEAYLNDLAERKAAEQFEKWQQKQAETQQHAVTAKQTTDDLSDLMAAGGTKYPDFQSLVGNQDLPISDVMMNAMLAVDSGHEVAYHLGKNPAEAARIAGLPPTSQARAIGQLAKQLIAPPPASAPLPQTLTTTRSTDGRFANAQAWTGPSPLNDILGKRN